MDSTQEGKPKLALLVLPWAFVRLAGRIVRLCLVAVGVLVVLGVVAYIELESIIEFVDSRYGREIDDYLGTDATQRSRGCNDPTYFAQQSVLVTEDQRTVACISSPEHRILIRRRRGHPAVLRQRDPRVRRQEFLHARGHRQGRDRPRADQAISQESRSGASTLTMQIAKHLRGGTGRASTEKEKIGDIVMALRIEREFSRQQLLLKYVNMPYFGRGSVRHRSGEPRLFRQAGERSRASPGRVHRRAHQQAGAARPVVRDGSAAQDRERNRDANWAEAARGTLRVLGLMLDQGAITMSIYARATKLVEKSLRKEIVPPGALAAPTTTSSSGCGFSTRIVSRSTRADSRSRSRGTTRCRTCSPRRSI